MLLIVILLIIVAIIFLYARKSKDQVLQTISFGKFVSYQTNDKAAKSSQDNDKGLIDSFNDFFDSNDGNNGGDDFGGDGGDDM